MTPVCFVGNVPTQMEYLRSTKGGVQLVLNEFMYYKGEAKGSKVSWRCIDYQRSKCRALCHTVDGHVTRTSGTHEHPPHTDTIRKRRQRQEAMSVMDWAVPPLMQQPQPQQDYKQQQQQPQQQSLPLQQLQQQLQGHVWHV